MKASNYYNQGYNCAESIIKKYNEEFNDNIPLTIGSGMGAGSCSGSMCGAINGSIIVIGYLYGRIDNNESNKANKYVRQLMAAVKEKYSTELCRELKAQKISCQEMIDFSYEILKDILNK